MATAFATAVLFDDHTHVETHQRPHICRQAAVSRRHQDAFPHTGHADGNLLDTRVQGAGSGVDTLEQLDFFRATDHFQGVIRRVQLRDVLGAERLHRAILPGARDGTCGACGQAQGLQGDRITVGKTGFLAGLRTYTNPLIKVETAFLDDAVFQGPGLGNLPLEIQVGRIDARPGEIAQHGLQAFDGHATGCQEVFTD